MKVCRVPALMGTGCLALLMGAYIAGAQQPGSSPSTGTPTTGSPNTGARSTGSMGAGQSGTAGTAGAQGGGGQAGDMSGNNGGGGSSDKHFVKEAMEGSMAEIQLGQLAQQKASSDDVKQFGQRMVQDHQKLSDQMQPIASQMGVQPPSELPSKDKALQKKLQGLSGAEFDKAYMSAMVKDHKKDLSEFKKEASSGKDPQVKQAAQQGSTVISEHLQMAQDIAQKVGAKGGKSGMSNGNGSSGTTGSTGSNGSTGSSTPQ